MKPSSSFSLLLFLQLASAAPMPEGLFPVDCHSTSCAAFRRFLSSTSNTPPTRLTSLHFPSHQLSSPDTLKSDGESFDHAPITPPPTTAPSSALSSEHPLISAFLVSLTSSFSQSAIQKAPLQKAPDEDEANALPVEPAAARKEDAARYWAALRPDSEKQANRGQTIGSDGPRHRVMLCGAQDLMSDYIALPRVLLTRDSTDLLVVCIVVLFMFALVALESVERFGFECVPFSLSPLAPFALLTSCRWRAQQIYVPTYEPLG